MSQFLPGLALEIVRLSAWLALLMVIFAPLEKRFALRKTQPFFRRAFGADVAFYYLSSLLPKLVLLMPLSFFAGLAHQAMSAGLYEWVAALPVWTRLLAALLVGEIGAYWGHRWSHQFPLLWRFHAIHHGAEDMDWLINTRAHPVDMVFTRLCGLVPMYLLGLAQPMANQLDIVPVLVTVIGTIWGFFIHANLNWRFGRLEWLIATPAFHHWHHTNDGAAVANQNYAAVLPWIDRCFGTFYLPKEKWPERYGTDTPPSPTVAGQLLQPFLPADQPSAYIDSRG